ncbi:MAG: 50S ribosomal protein L31 [Patescibacteria group bacterium]|jgi:large subunit ribosomal protein L31
MKNDIHPKYNDKVKVICSCGNTFETGSTLAEIRTEVCSACHPFYTGKQKIVDSARRVEKFHARVAAKSKVSPSRKGKKVKQAARTAKKSAASSAKPEKTAAKKTKK